MKQFPPPWTVKPLSCGFKVTDASGQSLAYVYGYANKREADIAKTLTLADARWIAENIARLPTLIRKD
jgi:hypothetical protein